MDEIDIFIGNYSGDCVEFIDGIEFSVERYRKNASVSKGNVPRVYVMSSIRKKIDKHGTEHEAEIKIKDAKGILDDFVEQACAEFGDDIIEEVFEWSPISQCEEGTSSTALQAEKRSDKATG